MKYTEQFFSLAWWVLVFWVAWNCVVLVMTHTNTHPFNRDNTDSPYGRSGMSLHIDNMTGCEYLGGQNGGLTPRLNKAGEQVGCR